MKTGVQLFASWFFYAMVGVASAATLDADIVLIVLDRELHVTTAEGTDLVIGAGQYEVEASVKPDPAIILRKQTDTVTVTIPATTIHHEELLTRPSALLLSDPPENTHVVVVLPSGVALDAVGYFDAVRSRDAAYPNVISRNRLQSALAAQAAQRQGAAPPFSAVMPPSPVLQAELQRQAEEAAKAKAEQATAQERAKAEMEPAAMLARIKMLEFVLSCMVVEGFSTVYGPVLPPPRVYPSQSADIKWNGMKCPGK